MPASPQSESVFQGSRARALEYSLVLEARGIQHEIINDDMACGIWVPTEGAAAARAELQRYAGEARPRRELPPAPEPFAGAWSGAIGYAAVLLSVGYLAGVGALQVNWFDAGGLDHRVIADAQWWRCITALTLHVDQAHVMGNLLFGIGFGVLAGRTFGAGIAWLATVVAAAIANYVDVLIAPISHRAVGASTAVFAALGLLTGFAWQTRFVYLGPRERFIRRCSPVAAGLGLLVLLGDGAEHVDVLGHVCGFVCGTALGWMLAHWKIPRERMQSPQWMAASVALALLAAAWLLALHESLI